MHTVTMHTICVCQTGMCQLARQDALDLSVVPMANDYNQVLLYCMPLNQLGSVAGNRSLSITAAELAVCKKGTNFLG